MSALPHPPFTELGADVGFETFRWTRAAYHRAHAAGVFGDESQVELIDGEVVRQVSPQSIRHANAVAKISRALNRIVGNDLHVRTQLPVAVSEWSEPEPDISVADGDPDIYTDHPTGGSIRLAVEVSETSFAIDQRKGVLYAQSGIVEYWVVALPQRLLYIHRNPGPTGYGQITILSTDDRCAPLFAPREEILVDDLMPKA